MPDTANLTALLLTDQQVAAMLQIPVSAVRWEHRRRRLRGISCARRLRWTRESVDEYIEARAAEAMA